MAACEKHVFCAPLCDSDPSDDDPLIFKWGRHHLVIKFKRMVRIESLSISYLDGRPNKRIANLIGKAGDKLTLWDSRQRDFIRTK